MMASFVLPEEIALVKIEEDLHNSQAYIEFKEEKKVAEHFKILVKNVEI